MQQNHWKKPMNSDCCPSKYCWSQMLQQNYPGMQYPHLLYLQTFRKKHHLLMSRRLLQDQLQYYHWKKNHLQKEQPQKKKRYQFPYLSPNL